MFRQGFSRGCVPAFLSVLLASPAAAQSFRVQCPTSTLTHPDASANNGEPAYSGPTQYACSVTGGCAGSGATNAGSSNAGYLIPTGNVNGAVKCQQISGGDGYATMGDGTQTYLFSFGPLSGVMDVAAGGPGTEPPSIFNVPYLPTSPGAALPPGYPAVSPSGGSVSYNGAIGLANNVAYTLTIYDISESGHTVTVVLNSPSPFKLGDSVVIGQGNGTDLAGYVGTFTVTAINVPNAFFPVNYAFQYTNPTTGLADVTESTDATASSSPGIDGHVDPRQLLDVGVMNGNVPAPLMAIDEDDEFFLTLSNVGMIMRPDLFEQHTVHFHGYPNASAFYDGVPDASVAINIGASFTYYYLAPDAGTYFWHCHITPPEHLQMGMVGQLFVRPRQDRVPAGGSLYAALVAQQGDRRTACTSATDVLCSNPLPATASTTSRAAGGNYAYNDGDGSTYYDLEYPLQIHGFDPNFHFVGMTFNPEGFTDMKDKYFLLNGRSYPDTVTPGSLQTVSSDGVPHDSQPLPAIIDIPAGKRALLRISSLDVSEYQTLASLGLPMKVIGYNAKLLRDQAGNNLYYATNSITLGGGESLDAILDACAVRSNPSDPSSTCTTPIPTGTYYLYTPNLDHLSNDAENFGGLMTEVHVHN
jgi:FtsP/CotA-like multicopper oxidase with cupredoxin domain